MSKSRMEKQAKMQDQTRPDQTEHTAGSRGSRGGKFSESLFTLLCTNETPAFSSKIYIYKTLVILN